MHNDGPSTCSSSIHMITMLLGAHVIPIRPILTKHHPASTPSSCTHMWAYVPSATTSSIGDSTDPFLPPFLHRFFSPMNKMNKANKMSKIQIQRGNGEAREAPKTYIVGAQQFDTCIASSTNSKLAPYWEQGFRSVCPSHSGKLTTISLAESD